MELLISFTIMIAGTLWIGLLLAALFGKMILSLLPVHHSKKGNWPANAVEAEAIVLKMEQTGLYTNKLPQVKLQMQVQPDKGRNFIAEINTVLSGIEAGSIKAGGIVRVKYNPVNYKELVLLKAG
jgi:hypothetical protein